MKNKIKLEVAGVVRLIVHYINTAALYDIACVVSIYNK